MPKPPQLVYLLTLVLLFVLSACINSSDRFEKYPTRKAPQPISPLLGSEEANRPVVDAPLPVGSTQSRLRAPEYEDPASVPPWARPVAPQGSYNSYLSPDGRYFVYLARYPGTFLSSLYSVPLAGGAPVLLSSSDVDGDIFYPTITADSTHVIYYGSSRKGLYSVSITGTVHLTLTSHSIYEMVVSADSEWVVYLGEGTDGKSALHSIPVRGGDPIRLSGEAMQSSRFQIVPDSRTVVFATVRQDGFEQVIDLHSVPIDGGEIAHLNVGSRLPLDSTFLVTSDGKSVIYGNLYIIPVGGGVPRQLSPFAHEGSVAFNSSNPPQISPDGSRVLFLAGDRDDRNRALFSVPLAGGETLQLNGLLGDGEDVISFSFGPDGQSVLYEQGLSYQEPPYPVYRVDIAGGTPFPLPAWKWVRFSPDGRWYVYAMPSEGLGSDIYSLPVSGESTPIQLNSSVPVNSGVESAWVNPDSQSVIYATSRDAGGGMPLINGLYRVPIEGGEAIEVTGVDGQDRIYSSFFFGRDSQTFFASMDYDGNGSPAYYMYTLAPSPAPQ